MPAAGRCRCRLRSRQSRYLRSLSCCWGKAVRPQDGTREAGERLWPPVPTRRTASRVGTGYGRISPVLADKVSRRSPATRARCHPSRNEALCPTSAGRTARSSVLAPGRLGAGFSDERQVRGGYGPFSGPSGILGMELAELEGRRTKPAAISSMCAAVFAETEIIGLLAQGTPTADIAAGVFRSIARRMRGLAARIPSRGECTFTGPADKPFVQQAAFRRTEPVNVPHRNCRSHRSGLDCRPHLNGFTTISEGRTFMAYASLERFRDITGRNKAGAATSQRSGESRNSIVDQYC